MPIRSPRRQDATSSPWMAAVPVVALLGGLLFAVSSQTADGEDLRSDRSEITQLIADREHDVQAAEAQRKQLADEVGSLADAVAATDSQVAASQAQVDALADEAGLEPVSGPAVRVTLTDAQLGPGGKLPPGARPDDVIIHQSDVQAVVNAMWAAGAEAVSIMDQRIIGTSAVRCVGNTLLLGGVTYSPPFVIVAIGDQQAIIDSLESAPGVQIFLDAVEAFDLGYEVEQVGTTTIAGYEGSLGITHATAVR